MPQQVFINLATRDLPKSIAFFKTLGFKFNAQFTDENAACMRINEYAYVMLLSEARFKDFTKKTVVDSRTHSEVIIALSADSRADVDTFVSKALASGGSPANAPQDHGFMYGSSFYDLDGHLFEVIWMDPSFVQPEAQ